MNPTLGALLAATLCVAVAACGGSSGEATEVTKTTGTSSEDAIAAAKEKIAPYVDHPSAFPVTGKLKEIPKGATVDFMDCGLPACAMFWELMQEPAKMLGIKLEGISTGEAANTVSFAFDSVVTKQPDGVIVFASEIDLWAKQLKQLQEDGIPVVLEGVAEAGKHGIESPQAAENENELVGELMAS